MSTLLFAEEFLKDLRRDFGRSAEQALTEVREATDTLITLDAENANPCGTNRDPQ